MSNRIAHAMFLVGSTAMFGFAACGGEATPEPAAPTNVPATTASSAAPAPAESASSPAAAASSATAPVAAAPAASAAAPATDAPKTLAAGDVVGTVTLPGGRAGKGAIVYLEDGPKDASSKALTTWLDNKQMNFYPFISVVLQGSKLTFHNADPFPHNVFSPDHERFDLGSISANGARARTFDKLGAYTLLCNLHPGMIGYVLVTPSSVFARADQKGNFKIAGVPGGTWHLNAWAPRMKGTAQTITVNGSEVKADFALAKE